MGKKILILPAGAVLGAGLSLGMAHFAALWGIFPGRELNRSTNYVRDVLQIVHENYVDPAASAYDALT